MTDSRNVRVLGRRSFELNALIFRAADLHDQWIAHSPRWDVMSQGNSPEHAAEMIMEATMLTVLDDLIEGVNSDVVRQPDPEVAAKVAAVIRHGHPLERVNDVLSHQDHDYCVVIQWLQVVQVQQGDNKTQPIEGVDAAYSGSLEACA